MLAFNDGARAGSVSDLEEVWLSLNPIPRLGNYSRLKKLAIPEICIPYHAFHTLGIPPMFDLPSGIEELQIQYSMWKWGPDLGPDRSKNYDQKRISINRMAELIREKIRGIFPELKLVVWWYQQPASYVTMKTNEGGMKISHWPTYGTECEWETLKIDFERLGVEFDWVSTPFFEDTRFGRTLGVSHARRRPPGAVLNRPIGRSDRVNIRPDVGLYYNESTYSIF